MMTTASAMPGRLATRLGRDFATALVLLLPLGAAAQEDRLWESIGPRVITNSNEITGITDREVVGAVNSVAPHPSDADEMFIGAVNSGVWRTDNATSASPVWVDVSGDLPSLSIGAVTYDMADGTFDTVLVGAGRYSSSARRGGLRFGVYRTQNRGGDWVDIDGTTLDGQSVNAIAANGNRILVSTGGSVGGPGLFLGQNAGGAWGWTQLSGRVPPGGGAAILPAGTTYDVRADPTTAGRYYTMNSSGVYRVTLPAATPENAAWTKVSSAAIDAQLGGAAHGRLAVGPGGEVFVAISTSTVVLSSFWRSPDGSTGWQSLDTPITNGFGQWFLAVAADPSDGNVAYVGGGGRESEYRIDGSLVSGSQASRITRAGTASDSRPHADVRDMRFDANGDLIEGNDGGVYKQTNPTDATGDWLSLNGNLLATEYLDLAWDAVSHVAMGGAIDNGTSIQNGFVRDRWLHIHGGDGGDAAINDTGSAVQSQRYTSSQNLGSFTRRTYDQNNTQLATNAAPMTPPTCAGGVPCFTPNWQFITPVAVNVVNPVRIVVGGSNGVYESTDQGQNIVQLLDGGGAAVPGVNSGSSSSDPLASGADGNADALYLGSADDVWVRTAGGFGSAMAQTDPSATRVNAIVDVVIDPGDDQTAFAIDSGAVFWTSNAGGAWTNITGNLAMATTATLRSIAYSTSNADGAVIVGTDNGVFIARGDGSSVNDVAGSPIPFTDWDQLGVGLPAAAIYDLEYDPADELLVAATFGRGAWAVNMEERDPIDVALVMDKSGSMGDPACPGCDDKMDVMQDAAELFIQTWQMLSDSDDRIAAVFFDSTIDTFSGSGGDQLVTLTSSGDNVIAYIRTKSDGGATAMGGGAQTAINLLTDDTRPRSLIILTDGMQNRDPMIELQGGTYEIRNTGRTSSGVAPTVPPTQLDDALDITVNTIGVGVTAAYEAELSAISGGTAGLHKSTTNADADLRRFYIEQLVDALRDASPQLIDYRYASVAAGGTDTQSFDINVGAKKVVLSVSWQRTESRLIVSIFKDGKNVTRLADEVRSGSFYDVFSFDTTGRPGASDEHSGLSSDGEWEVRVQGPGEIDYEVAALADDGTLDYEFEVTPWLLHAGRPTMLAAEVGLNGLPYGDNVGARVEIGIPQEGIATALALTPTPRGLERRNGETLAEAKLRYLLLNSPEFRERISRRRTSKTLTRTGAGRFSAPFSDTTTAGTYKLSFLLHGSGPPTGDFQRREERFFIVKSGPFRPGSSGILTVDVTTASGVTTTTIHIRPRDIYGNYLGSDQADKVGAVVTGSGETAVVTDIGEGWYKLVVSTSSIDPEIQISVGDDVVATGKADEIDVKEPPPIVTGRPPEDDPSTDCPCPSDTARFFSLHAGLVDSHGALGNVADNGSTIYLDYIQPLRPKWAWDVRLGYSRFDGRAGFDDTDLWNLSANARYTVNPSNPVRVFLNAGLGLYHFDPGDFDGGGNLGLGLNVPLGPRYALEATYNYHWVFASPSLEFDQIQVGVLVSF